MTEFIKQLYSKFRNLILYGIIGCCSSGLDFVLYTIFVQIFGLYYILSNCISVLCGITTSFILNRNINFRVKDKTEKRFAIFLTVGLWDACQQYNTIFVHRCIEYRQYSIKVIVNSISCIFSIYSQ